MKRGGYLLSEELLKKKLGIPDPEGIKITGIKWVPDTCQLAIFVYGGKNMRETMEGFSTELIWMQE